MTEERTLEQKVANANGVVLLHPIRDAVFHEVVLPDESTVAHNEALLHGPTLAFDILLRTGYRPPREIMRLPGWRVRYKRVRCPIVDRFQRLVSGFRHVGSDDFAHAPEFNAWEAELIGALAKAGFAIVDAKRFSLT